MLNSCGNIDVVYSAPPQLKIITESQDCGDITFDQPVKIKLLCNPLGGGVTESQVQEVINSNEYKHIQSVSSSQWVINHNLNKIPLVIVYDSAGNVWNGEQSNTNLNQTIIDFSVPFSGTARLI